jgi:hypothetical protein
MDHSHEVSLDINEIKRAFSQACCIYRVPERLWKLNEKRHLE